MIKEELKFRDIYLRKLALGEYYGPQTGYPDVDKNHLRYYSEKDILESIPCLTIYKYCLKIDEAMDKTMLSFRNKRITKRQVIKWIDCVAEVLVNDYGVKKGDKVSVCLPTIPETYYIFYALNKIGAIANFIDPRINEERIAQCMGKDNKLIFIIDVFAEKFFRVTREMDVNVVVVSGAQSLNTFWQILYRLKANIKTFKSFIPFKTFVKGKTANSHNKVQEVEYEHNLVAGIVYTSGTTGIPKGVKLTNENIISVAFHQKKNMQEMKNGDKYLVIMPPFIAYGLVCGLCCPTSTNQNMILIPNFNVLEFPKLIRREKPNHMLGVPSFFEAMMKDDKLASMDLSFIKYIIVGGDKLNITTEQQLNDFLMARGAKMKVTKGYGMTELSSAAFSTPNNDANKLGSVGCAYLKNIVRIVDPQTKKKLKNNESGEIYVYSPSKMLGYVDNQREEINILHQDSDGCEWIKTGDIGYVDEYGNLTISGRIKRMIVRPDGHNVFPVVIEDLLNTHIAVENCVVVGTEFKETISGRIPTAFVVLKKEFQGKEGYVEEQLNRLQATKLPPRDVALKYVFIDKIPLTSVGKIDYLTLENMKCELS